MIRRLAFLLLAVSGCLEPVPLEGFTFTCSVDADCRPRERCVGGVCSSATAGGTAGGSAAGGTTAGGNTSGGTTAGGNASGGMAAGGNASGGTTAGGNASGGTTAGGNASGGTTAGGDAGGTTAGGNASGGTTAGGNASGGATAGGNASGGTTAGGNASGGTTAGGNASGGTTAGGAAGGSSLRFPNGDCRPDQWCWVNPTPAGVFGAVEVRNANEFYAASLDTVYRLFPDGGLTSTGFSTTAPITDLEFRSNELWAMTSSGPSRLNPNPQSFSGAYGALLSSTSGALWAHGGAQVFRWTGTTWNTVTSTAPGPCSFAAAAVGGSLFRFCGTIPSTVLEELGPTMTLNVRTIDGGTLQSIGGRSPSTFLGVSLNPSMSSTVLVRISLAGDLLPLGPIQGSGEQVVFVSADETSAAFPGSYIELSSTTIQPTPVPLSGPVGASGSTFLLLQSGVPTSIDVLGGAVPFLYFTRGIAGSTVPLFFSTSVGDLISCGGGTLTTNGLHSPSSTTALAEHPETGEILFATFNRIQRQRGATIDTLPDAGLNVRFIEPMPDGGFLVAGENANVTFTRRWNGVAWEDVPIPFTLSGRRLGGLSVGDAGMFLSTSQALFAWTGTAWQSLPVPNVVGGDYGAVCATDDGLTLIEQLPSSPSGFRSVQRRRGSSSWQSTLRSRGSHLVCRGGQGFDLANFSDTTYTRWLSDGGSQDVSERFDVKDVFFDREGRQYLATQSCGLLRKQ